MIRYFTSRKSKIKKEKLKINSKFRGLQRILQGGARRAARGAHGTRARPAPPPSPSPSTPSS
jgi:hypothetical protein